MPPPQVGASADSSSVSSGDDCYLHHMRPKESAGSERAGSQATRVTFKSSRSRAWLLALAALLVLGDAWVYDTPGAIYTSLSARFRETGSYTASMNRVLYSVYNWPNVVLALLAGFLIDWWWGLRPSTVSFAFLVLLGQLLFSIAVLARNYPLAVMARFVYGLGGDTLKVAQNTWTALLASVDNMSWTFGLVLGVSRLAGAINFAVTPTLAANSVLLAVWIGFGVTFLSFVAAVLLRLATNAPSAPTRPAQRSPIADGSDVHATERCPPSTVRNHLSQEKSGNPTGEAADDEATPFSVSPRKPTVDPETKTESPEESIQTTSIGTCTHLSQRLRAIHRVLSSFSKQVWLQFAVCVFYHVSVLLLYEVASDFLQNTGARHSERIASLFVSIPAFIAIIGTPLSGYLVDRYGHALWSILVACFLLILAHGLLLLYVFGVIENASVNRNVDGTFSTSDASAGLFFCIFAFVLVGISYSMATASIWPLVPFLVPEQDLAIAYGGMASIENLGLAVMPLVISRIQDSLRPSQASDSLTSSVSKWQYIAPLFIFAFMAAIAAIVVLYQIHIDKKEHNGRLNKPARERGGWAQAHQNTVLGPAGRSLNQELV